jgi:hypothetical protein
MVAYVNRLLGFKTLNFSSCSNLTPPHPQDHSKSKYSIKAAPQESIEQYQLAHTP